MTKEQAKEILRHRTNLGYGIVIENESTQVIEEALETAIEALEQQPSDDYVSRKAILDAITEIDGNINMDIYTNEVREIVKELPPVTPIHGMCKDCKHWKDSDGVYRRGIGAESKCSINNSKVFEGTFYCTDFEKRGNENGSN